MATNETMVGTVKTVVAPRALERLPRVVRNWTAPGKVFYASTMAANAIGYVFFFVMARLLDVADYGELVTLTALVYVFGVITRTMQAKAAQAVTILRSADTPTNAAGGLVLRQLLRPLVLGTVLILVITAVISGPVASFLRLDSVVPVLVLGAYVATHYLLSGPRGILLGSGRLYFLSVVTLVDPLVRLAVAVGLVLGGQQATSILWAYVAGNLAATLLGVSPFVAAAFVGLRRNLNQPALRWLTYDKHFLFALFINSALMALPSIDPVAVRRFFSEEVAGTYAAAFLLGRIILLSTNAASWVVFSRAVQIRPHDPRTLRILARGLLLAGGFASVVTLGYALAPRLAAMALGGRAFQSAADFVGLVGVEMVVFSFVSVLAYYHVAIRNTRIWVPFVLALVLEGALLAFFHATPYQVLYDTVITLLALLAWLSVETALVLRPVRSALPHSGGQPRICMVVHSHYPSDPRVRRETEALVSAGWDVEIVCVPDSDEPASETLHGVRVRRMPVTRNRFGSQLSYLAEYGRFFVAASLHVAREHFKRPFQVVQVHNMPDFLVFTALVPKLFGARVVLDVHDLVPEFYALRFGLTPEHHLVRLARWVQRQSARFADQVLTAGEPFRQRLGANGVNLAKITSIMNSPDPGMFASRTTTLPGPNTQFVLSYHGTLTEYNDLTVVLRAMALLRDELPGLVFNIYGRGRALPGLKALAAELGVAQQVKFHGFQPLDAIPALIAGADLGLVPQRQSDFTALNYPTKAFEYIALGVPVLMTSTPALEELFGHVEGVFFSCDEPERLAAQIRRLDADREAARALAQKQHAVCASFAWPIESQRYVAVMQRLVQTSGPVLEPVIA